MNRFATGLVTGGVLAAVGVSWLLADDKTKKRVVKDSRKKLRKAGHMIDDMTDMF